MKLFLDANILFSASDPKSATHQLLMMASKTATLITSPHAENEARRNLANKRAHLLPGLESLLLKVSFSHALGDVSTIKLEEKDKPILAGAIASGCTHLWTSDKMHFGHLYGHTVKGVTIVSSLQLFAISSARATGQCNT